jgi:hypothetical protein
MREINEFIEVYNICILIPIYFLYKNNCQSSVNYLLLLALLVLIG